MIKNAYVGYTCTCIYIYKKEQTCMNTDYKSRKELGRQRHLKNWYILWSGCVKSRTNRGARFSIGLIVIMPVTFIFYSFFLMKTE